MEVDSLKRIIELARAELAVEDIGGVPHSAVPLHDVTPKLSTPSTMELSTLTGLVDFIDRNPDALDPARDFIHVEGPRSVAIVSGIQGPRNQRFTYARTAIEMKRFPFDQYLEPEAFVIALNTMFVESEDLTKVVQLAGNVTNERSVTVQDDGITQEVGQRRGIALRDKAEIVNPFSLNPFRTFREINQPGSPFILRMKGGGDGGPPVVCALFEADGGEWELEAIDEIATWLAANDALGEFAIVR